MSILQIGGKVGLLTIVGFQPKVGKIVKVNCTCECGKKVTRNSTNLLMALRQARKSACDACVKKGAHANKLTWKKFPHI